MAQRGGKRPGAGRKANPLKELRTGALTAEKILRELGHEKEIIKLYGECGDPRLKVHILFRLREWAYGKATQPLEHAGGDKPVDIADDVRSNAAKRLSELLERAAARAPAAHESRGAGGNGLPDRG
jgi:hypothetical protein